MLNKPQSLTEYLLKEDKDYSSADDLTKILTQIQYAAKIIASHIHKAGLVDILGFTGEKNTFDEEIKKLDDFGNKLMIDVLKETGQVAAAVSEELDEPTYFPTNDAPYYVFFDPIDGFSNTDISAPLGTIFSIYKNTGSLLQVGKDQVAAGYILYGSSDVFVYTRGLKVVGFTLDPSIGSFLLSHPDLSIPEFNSLYSVNEGNYLQFPDGIKNYLDFIKIDDAESKRPYKQRYSGCMVSDLHQILLKGGLFLYPPTKKDPRGKLRLMYEINPFSFIIKAAGGGALSGDIDPLELMPKTIHDQASIVIGSSRNLDIFKEQSK